MGVDVIDFTDLQRRGLFKVEKNEQESPDMLDFTVPSTSSEQTDYFTSSEIPVTTSATEQPNPFDMLSSLAQVGETTSNAQLNPETSENSGISLKLDTIVNKLEDTMYKIETISSRIAMLESKLDSMHSR